MSRRWKVLTVAALIAVAVWIGFSVVAGRLSAVVRDRAVRALEQRYQSTVRIDHLEVRLFPRPSLRGDRIEFRAHGRTDVPPMITLDRFVAQADLWGLLSRPMHIRSVRLEGLHLHVPHPGEAREGSGPAGSGEQGMHSGLVIDTIDADGTELEILPKSADRAPLEFQIARLRLQSAGNDRPMQFRATLTNPKPPGLIESEGHFGPWQSGQPGNTPVDGHYAFQNADLGVFKGIAGILSSTGVYRGQLNNIEVDGKTDVPDFVVKTGGHRVHLTTEFHAVVNGTDGDTYLDPVNARFLNTFLVCRGKVEHQPGVPGKFIQLRVKMEQGRIEDLLKLAVKGDPLMTGTAEMETAFLLPPGGRDVLDRLQLDGQFGIARGKFTRNSIQEKITDLSLRGQGRPKEAQELSAAGAPPGAEVASALRCDFKLKDGVVSLANLSFHVPGAQLRLDGTYGLNREDLHFDGVFRMEARVSEAFTGWKSLLLKAADPFFAKNGAGTEIPIRIGGTRENPSFGLELVHRGQRRPSK